MTAAPEQSRITAASTKKQDTATMNDSRKTAPNDSTVATPGDAPEYFDLKTMRAELDRVDERLLECLRDRLECCKAIACHKRRFDIPMMQQHRIDSVQRRAAQYGRKYDIDLGFLQHLYTVVIEETCRVENLLIDATD
jgi:4-amino-4-deoxychorismate mutase